MIQVAYKYLSLFIILLYLLMSSCKTAGHFNVIKRKYLQGYFVETPYVQKQMSKNAFSFNKLIKNIRTSEVIKIDEIRMSEKVFSFNTLYYSKPLTEILLASIDKHYFVKNKELSFPPDTLKPQISKSNKTMVITDTLKIKKDLTYYTPISKKKNVLVLLAFSLSMLLPVLIVIWLLIWLSLLSVPLMLLLITLILPILIIVLALVGMKKINKNPEKYKGRSLAKAALILGFLFLFGIIVVGIIYLLFSLDFSGFSVI